MSVYSGKEGGYTELNTAGVHDSTHVNSLTTSPKDLFTWDFSTVLNDSGYFAVRVRVSLTDRSCKRQQLKGGRAEREGKNQESRDE